MQILIATARCCRDWTVAIGGWVIGTCGRCGEVPQVVHEIKAEIIEIPYEEADLL